ncbi:hypothetical protein ZEAMMB73_Zm00001d006559 [Zea mays]|uniref:Uncharacterized protein n=1 Tax=Zea mays TaxID=4577 RepID=A0A1D6EXS9_MAIZE|nr:hypothetical protein ZEAMMB73_Zm00001d006559 [Zea mays]
MAPIVGGRVGEVARVSPVVVVSFGPTVGRYCFHPPALTSLLHLIPSPPPARLPAVHRSPPPAAIQPPVQGSSSRSQPCPVPSRREARRLGSWSEDKETRERMQQLQPKQMHWVRADSSDFGGDRPAPRRCPCGGPARGRSHASRRAARNVFEERQLHSHLHRVVVAALSIQPFRV